MTKKLEISREQAQRWLDDMGPEKHETAPSLKRKREELRALLAADPVPPLIQTLHANGDLIAMEATIAQQAQRIADLERGRGKPVAVLLLGDVFHGSYGPEVEDWDIHWEREVVERLSVERPGEHLKLYASLPEPVVMVLPDRNNATLNLDIEQCGYVEGWNACLDKVKELNQ